ncbi:MAG TPA: ATP-binding protein [Holophagaceae bacterium]|jgi:two-component system cell cycle sensor histidine kinase/response regulator CckA|nr:ATP-binding protein [Holophagaceae bacterium]
MLALPKAPMADPELKTVAVPSQMEPLFRHAEEVVSRYFRERQDRPEEGTIEIFGQRYVLVRAASLSVEFFSLVRDLYGEGRESDADAFARNLLFDLAHAIGKADAKAFHVRMGLQDPVAKLSAGPVHFAHTGWAFVDISPESLPSPDEDFYLLYDHPYSFESDAWVQAGKSLETPVCIMNAGYSSGWCEESFGLPLASVEVLCKAKGDSCCRFIMAPPARLEARLRAYSEAQPELATRIKGAEIPDFFSRKRLEEELRRHRDELELRVEERTRQLEEVSERLRRTQKFEALGRLAGGIAHDFSNLLTAMVGFAGLARIELPENHPAVEALDQLEATGLRAGELTRQLLAFSRRQVLQPVVLDLNTLLQGMTPLLKPLLGERVQLELALGPGTLKVRADPSQMEQVVLNLAVNARDAMPEGGRLRIETALEGREVKLDVLDTGTGIPPEAMTHLFEPFFTTKSRGQGTGLGLSTVYGIVEQSSGRIAVENEPGGGARVRIHLPASDEPLSVGNEGAAPIGSTEKRVARILVVEDGDDVRSALLGALKSRGYEAVGAADPRRALDLEPELGHLDLLVTDMVMPGMDGKQLADAFRIRRPDLAVLFMSGFTEALGEGEAHRFLAKPFSLSVFLAKVSALLPARPG